MDRTECDAGKARGSERGLPLSAIFSVSIQMALSNGLALSIKPFTINTHTVARRDLDLAPIIAAFAPFFS
jgi:hypothetical protein